MVNEEDYTDPIYKYVKVITESQANENFPVILHGKKDYKILLKYL